MLSLFRPATVVSLTSARALFFSTSALVFKDAPKKAKKPTTTTTTATDKSKKKKKNEVKVKGPINAYAAFNSEYYKTRGDELKGLGIGEKSKIISQAWKALSSRDVERFSAIAAKDLARYVEEKAKITPPKRPANSYARFFSEVRASLVESNPELSFAELGKLGGEKWRALGDSEKAKYKAAFEQEAAAYRSDVEKFKATL
jgi:hypothetical protein